jgi:hypothetical protein
VKPLLYPYAYCADAGAYFTPDDPRAQLHVMTVGSSRVSVRRSARGRSHFYHPEGGGHGATGPETAAHIFAKMYLQRSKRFYGIVDGERTLVRFGSCAVEQRLNARTPDVTVQIAHVWPPRYPAGTTFLIEIHATNGAVRDPARIPALRAFGFPCVEVTVPERLVKWRFNESKDEYARDRFEKEMVHFMRMPHATWLVPENVKPYPTAGETVRFLIR